MPFVMQKSSRSDCLSVFLSYMMFDVLSNDYCCDPVRHFIWMQCVVDDIIWYFYITSRGKVCFRYEEIVYIKYDE